VREHVEWAKGRASRLGHEAAETSSHEDA
jgi:hypothetical protein